MTIAARPLNEWHEDDGPVLWWRFPVDEPPYIGTPLDRGEWHQILAPDACRDSLPLRVGGWPGYHTHWTPIPIPDSPEGSDDG